MAELLFTFIKRIQGTPQSLETSAAVGEVFLDGNYFEGSNI